MSSIHERGSNMIRAAGKSIAGLARLFVPKDTSQHPPSTFTPDISTAQDIYKADPLIPPEQHDEDPLKPQLEEHHVPSSPIHGKLVKPRGLKPTRIK